MINFGSAPTPGSSGQGRRSLLWEHALQHRPHLSHVNSQNHDSRGYTKKDGTYVAPSHATNPNATTHDNYTHKGNVNPHTGKEGEKP